MQSSYLIHILPSFFCDSPAKWGSDDFAAVEAVISKVVRVVDFSSFAAPHWAHYQPLGNICQSLWLKKDGADLQVFSCAPSSTLVVRVKYNNILESGKQLASFLSFSLDKQQMLTSRFLPVLAKGRD